MQPTPGHQSVAWSIFYFTLSLAAGKIKAFQGLSSAINPLGRRRKEKKAGCGGRAVSMENSTKLLVGFLFM